MANTYTQLHIHIVFAVNGRKSLINPSWKNDLYKYITGIINNQKHKLIAINGMPDHIHILIGLNPSQSLSDLLQDIKGSSSKWINQQKLVQTKFEWQSGYGAFSYAKSQLNTIINYINNQEKHHTTKTFKEEYINMLQKFEIDFHPQYIFKDIE